MWDFLTEELATYSIRKGFFSVDTHMIIPMMKTILDDEETFNLILQLTDIAAEADRTGDIERRDKALEEIRQLRQKIAQTKYRSEQE